MHKICLLLIILSFQICGYSQTANSIEDTRDGNIYKIVKIGNQWWMAENLRFESKSGCSWYEELPQYRKIFGCYYSFEVAKTVCPAGWHLPSDVEWLALANSLGGVNFAGGKLKSKDIWVHPNAGATNETGFSAVPTGGMDPNGNFVMLGTTCYFWSSKAFNKIGNDYGSMWLLGTEAPGFKNNSYDKKWGLNVRCIKDMPENIQAEKLMDALKAKDCTTAKDLVTSVESVDYVNEQGRSLLMEGIGCTDVVITLLDKGAQVDLKSASGKTALSYASVHGNTEIVKLLLDKGANPNLQDADGYTALIHVSEIGGYLEVVKLLLDKGAQVNLISIFGTALSCASENGYTEIVKLLLNKGANLDLQDAIIGWTALMKASSKGHSEVVKLLLDKGANPNLKSKAGKKALDYADNDDIKTLLTSYMKRQ
jgi:uncharacterized protein (TIGR02145 family)